VQPHKKAQQLRAFAAERILVIDGAYGSMIQSYGLDEAGYRGSGIYNHDQKGNNDLLNLTRPDIVAEICNGYVDAGADILATNTFNANSISLADYGMQSQVREVNLAAAKIIRDCCDAATLANPAKPRFVAGSVGPTNKTLSISPDVNNPGYRAVEFDEMVAVYREQIDALMEGGVDFILVETIFDTLNAKAALFAVAEAAEALGTEIPVMISMTLTDLSGRNLTGQTVDAFWASVRHARPLTMGLNCSFGATELRAYVTNLNKRVDTLLCVYPNAGLPNDMGGYDELPETTGALVKSWAQAGLMNIIGGCCGTTPAHIAAIAKAVEGITPRAIPVLEPKLTLSGLEVMAA
jgi:5-methyltetrahydrofolate--homocysteine methyltransferase